MGGMGAMDLNDYDFDAYLANDRTLDDPDVVKVDKGGKILVRIINAASATVLDRHRRSSPRSSPWTASPSSLCSAPVRHRHGPAAGPCPDDPDRGPPDPALREGAVERTGIILATAGASVAKIEGTGDAAPAFSGDMTQEAALRAATPLADRPATNQQMLMLGGSMLPYVWTINGATSGSTTNWSSPSLANGWRSCSITCR